MSMKIVYRVNYRVNSIMLGSESILMFENTLLAFRIPYICLETFRPVIWKMNSDGKLAYGL